MNPTTTRRGAIAALAAAIPTGAILTSSPASATRPRVTIWHQLQRRAGQLSHRQSLTRAAAPSPAELDRQLRQLTQLVADLTDALVDEHTAEVSR